MPDEAEFSDGLRQMAGVVLSEKTLQAVLDLAVSLAIANLHGADGVSVSLRRDRRVATAVALPTVLSDLDAVQYEHHQGPCITALETGDVIDAVLAEHEPDWPRFVTAASGQGFASVLSTPMRTGHQEPVGALNVYSSRSAHFSDDEHHDAATFAGYAAVVLANAASFATTTHQIEQLHLALQTRELIGEAKGIVMQRDGLTSDEAFAWLRQMSQHTNRKLRDVAQDVIDSIGHGDRGR